MGFGTDFQAKAAEQRALAANIMNDLAFDSDPKKQLLSTVGFITANIYDALAQMDGHFHNPTHGARKVISARNAAMRRAAARATCTGDWNEFDRLVGAAGGAAEDGAPTAGSGSAGSPGDGPGSSAAG